MRALPCASQASDALFPLGDRPVVRVFVHALSLAEADARWRPPDPATITYIETSVNTVYVRTTCAPTGNGRLTNRTASTERLLHACHETLEERREEQHNGAADHAPPEDLEKQPREGQEICGVVFAGKLSGEVVAERGGEEPHTHDLADEPRRREFGHGRKPHRRQAELAPRMQRVG